MAIPPDIIRDDHVSVFTTDITGATVVAVVVNAGTTKKTGEGHGMVYLGDREAVEEILADR